MKKWSVMNHQLKSKVTSNCDRVSEFIKWIVTTTNFDWMSHIQRHIKCRTQAHSCTFYITRKSALILGNHKHASADRSVYLTTHLTHATITKITAMQALSWLQLEFIKSSKLRLESVFVLHISDSNIENKYIELKRKNLHYKSAIGLCLGQNVKKDWKILKSPPKMIKNINCFSHVAMKLKREQSFSANKCFLLKKYTIVISRVSSRVSEISHQHNSSFIFLIKFFHKQIILAILSTLLL